MLATQKAKEVTKHKNEKSDVRSEETTHGDVSVISRIILSSRLIALTPLKHFQQQRRKVPKLQYMLKHFVLGIQKTFFAQKIQKSAETIAGIHLKLSISFIFTSLDDKEQEIVIDFKQDKIAVANKKIIVKGILRDCLNVVCLGTLSCNKVLQQRKDPKFFKQISLRRLLKSLPLFTTHLVLPQLLQLMRVSNGCLTVLQSTTRLRDL